jgi:fermentation-respiration switch protein FrsA (DUF1100 family)
VHVKAADGLTLLAWYLPPAKPDGFVVLYLHGNGGHIGYRSERLRKFHAAGWGALLLEYRGYGGNLGSPTEAGLVLDAQAGLSEIQARGIPPDRTVIWGESLGTNLAVRLATENKFAGIILESPFTSIAAIASQQYPFVPVDLLLKDRFDTESRIAAVHSPTFILQGGRDRLVPNAMGKTLFTMLTAPKQLWLAPDSGHNDLATYGAVEAAITFIHQTSLPPPLVGGG